LVTLLDTLCRPLLCVDIRCRPLVYFVAHGVGAKKVEPRRALGLLPELHGMRIDRGYAAACANSAAAATHALRGSSVGLHQSETTSPPMQIISPAADAISRAVLGLSPDSDAIPSWKMAAGGFSGEVLWEGKGQVQGQFDSGVRGEGFNLRRLHVEIWYIPTLYAQLRRHASAIGTSRWRSGGNPNRLWGGPQAKDSA
jgi:hypothetical protein